METSVESTLDLRSVKTDFYRLLGTSKYQQAQELISNHRKCLSHKSSSVMLADLRLKQRRFGDVFQILDGLKDQPANKNQVSFLAARALLGLNQPRKVLGRLAEIDGDFPQQRRVLSLRLQVLLQLGRYQQILKVANRILKNNPKRTPIQKVYLSALILSGDTDKADIVLEAALKTPAAGEVLHRYVVSCLCAGNHALIMKRQQQIAQYNVSLSKCVSSSLKHLAAVEASSRLRYHESRAEFLLAVVACADLVDATVVAYDTAIQLADFDAPDEAQIFTDLCKFLVEKNYSWLEPRVTGTFETTLAQSGEDQKIVDEIARWAGVSAFDTGNWKAQVFSSERRHQELTVGLQISDHVRKDTHDAIELADWQEIAQRSSEGKSSILAGTHVGLMAATITQFVKQGMRVAIVGGNAEMKKFLPGGLSLVQVNRQNDQNREATRLACLVDVVRLLKSGETVAIAGDAPHSSTLQSVTHGNLEFQLPDSIPRLAWKYKAPVFWISTHWRNGELECAVEKSPGVDGFASYEAYRERWFAYYLDKIQDVASADPRNIRIEKFQQMVLRAVS